MSDYTAKTPIVLATDVISVGKFQILAPSKGKYECLHTGLRFETFCPARIIYEISDPPDCPEGFHSVSYTVTIHCGEYGIKTLGIPHSELSDKLDRELCIYLRHQNERRVIFEQHVRDHYVHLGMPYVNQPVCLLRTNYSCSTLWLSWLYPFYRWLISAPKQLQRKVRVVLEVVQDRWRVYVLPKCTIVPSLAVLDLGTYDVSVGDTYTLYVNCSKWTFTIQQTNFNWDIAALGRLHTQTTFVFENEQIIIGAGDSHGIGNI